MCARRPAQAVALARAAGAEAIARKHLRTEFFDAIVNATPVGMYPAIGRSPLEASRAELPARLRHDLSPARDEADATCGTSRHRNSFRGGDVCRAGNCAVGNLDGQARTGESDAQSGILSALEREEKLHARGTASPEDLYSQTLYGKNDHSLTSKHSRKLARQGNLVPVYETFTADLLTPVGALSAHRTWREIFISA